jgi:hypothetical protein
LELASGYSVPNPWWDNAVTRQPILSWAGLTVGASAAALYGQPALGLGAFSALKAAGGAISSGLSAYLSGAGAAKSAVAAAWGGATSGISPFGPLTGQIANTTLRATASGMLNSALTNFLTQASTKPLSQFSGLSFGVSVGGRGAFGLVTGFAIPEGRTATVAGQLGYDTAKGLVGGEIGGVFNILLNF